MELQGKLLVATMDMDDLYFDRAVVYVCEHNEQGAMGLLINSPTDLSVMELVAKMDFLMVSERNYRQDQLVLNGGPVNQDRGFILHTRTNTPLMHSYDIDEKYVLTTSGDVLETFGTAASPEHFLVCLGCCTWKANQLEQEIERNYWLVAPTDHKVLFESGYLDRWGDANELLGIQGMLPKAGRA